MSHNADDCLLCRMKVAHDKRKRMTKAALLAAFDEADDAFLNMAESESMAVMYYRALETHLRAHGCGHDFGDVADEPEKVA